MEDAYPTKPFSSKSLGFTIIELLITIGIIAIITGAMIPGFNSYIQTQNLRQAQDQLKSDLRTIQNRALSSVASTETLTIGGVSQKIRYWGIKFTPNSSTYDYFVSFNNNAASCTGTENISKGKSAVLSGGMVTRNAAVKCIYFSLDNGDAFVYPTGSNNLRVAVGKSTDTTCASVEINTAGLVFLSVNTVCN